MLDALRRISHTDSGGSHSGGISHDTSLDDDLMREVLQLGRMPRDSKDPQTDAEHAEKRLKMNLRNHGLVERAQRELLAVAAPYLRTRLRKKTSARSTAAELRHQRPHDRSSQDAPAVDGSGLRTSASTQRGSKRKRDGTEQISGDVHPTASTSADQSTFSVAPHHAAEASNVTYHDIALMALTQSSGDVHPTDATLAAQRCETSCGDAHPADVSIDENICICQTWTKKSSHF